MKPRILILIVGIAIIASGILIMVVQGKAGDEKLRRQGTEQGQNPLGTAISNYNQTFKLNTNPPLWPDAQKK